ncbi:uncharacterized protein TNCV_4546241 [Trichonephila clavipes]|nr:uncharacterized protein TNCV_4546241 [Trichonephila clavipes]
MYCSPFHPIPSHHLWERCATVNKRRIEAFTTGSSYTDTMIITAEIESGFIVKEDLVLFRQFTLLLRGTTPNGGVDGQASRATQVMSTTIPNVLQRGAFVGFEKTQGPLMNELHVPEWRPMKQLAVHVHFLQCGGLLNDLSVKGVLILDFV